MSDSLSVPLKFGTDDDGFFRRECPTCVRHFKVAIANGSLAEYLHEAHHVRSPEVQRHCPYCGAVAPPSHWWTQQQLDYIQESVKSAAAGVIHEELDRVFHGRGRGSRSGGISLTVRRTGSPPRPPTALVEPNDLRLVELAAGRRLKVLDEWAGPVRDHFSGELQGG